MRQQGVRNEADIEFQFLRVVFIGKRFPDAGSRAPTFAACGFKRTSKQFRATGEPYDNVWPAVADNVFCMNTVGCSAIC